MAAPDNPEEAPRDEAVAARKDGVGTRFRWLDWFWFLRHGLETLTEDLDKHDHCCYQAEKNRERLHCPAPKRRFGYS